MYRKFIKNLNDLYISVISVNKICLLVFLALILAYMPMLSYCMSLKNDAIRLSYPLLYCSFTIPSLPLEAACGLCPLSTLRLIDTPDCASPYSLPVLWAHSGCPGANSARQQ